MNSPEDTIAAVSTPWGAGGIGIVRLSGPRAGEILASLFRRRSGAGPLTSHRLTLGEILRPDGTAIDEVLAVFLGRPKTYTREDMAEIQAHGGNFLLQEILQEVLKKGARLAEPGEFTKRAFLNGRIDLTRAEAVIDLIQSKTRRSLEVANLQRQGRLAQEIGKLREELLDLTALLEAGIDFPQEEISEISPGELKRRLDRILNGLDTLLAGYQQGKIYRDGVAAAIIGRPNVGKSSLLNVLLGEDRAIVTPIPGTTRDAIEETVNLRGIPLKLMDTAGLRSSGDAIEMEGVRRTRDRLLAADLIIWVLDGSEPLTPEDLAILPQVGGKKVVLAVNKNDLEQRLRPEDLAGLIPQAPFIPISALFRTHIDRLEEALRGAILNGTVESSSQILVSHLRHQQGLARAREAVLQARQTVEAGLPPEFITLDLSRALQALGEIVGETTSEDLLNRIFSQFCIGK